MRRVIAIFFLSAPALLAQSTVTGSRTVQGSWDASGATATKPAQAGAALPATCGVGQFFFNTAAASGQNIYLCNPANTWTQVSGGGVSSVFGRNGSVAAQTNDYTFSQIGGAVASGQLPAAGGDISGALTSATVKALQGKAVGTTTPSTGQVLTWSGTQWAPQTVASSVGGDISGTIAAATVKAIQGETIGTTAPTTGQVLTWSGTQWAPQTAVGGALGGDLSGTTTAATVQAIQGRAVQSLAPASGQVLTWNGTQWTPESPTGGGAIAVTLPYLQTGGVYFGPLFIATPPNLQTWTWLNQSAASVTTTNGAMYLQSGAASVHSLSGQMIPTPAVPYTITATFLPAIYNFVYPGSSGGQTYAPPACGLFWYQAGSVGGSQFGLRTFGYSPGFEDTVYGAEFIISKYHSPTSYWADGGPLPFSVTGPIQMQFHDDGTNQTMQLSADGVNWRTIDSLASTAYIVADHVGFYCDTFASGTSPGMTLLSWLVH
jgi:hypothetical protein